MMNAATTMEAVVSDLEAYLLKAKVTVASSWDLFSGTAKTTATAYLERQGQAIAQLKGTLRNRVLNKDPTYSFERWAQFASEIRGGIASTINDTSTWKLSGVLFSTVKETASDVVVGVKQGAQAVADYGPFLVGAVVVALVAYAVIRVT